ASIPLELNYAKGQEGYVTRAAMVMLYNLMMLSEDSYLRVYNLKTNIYPLTGGMFVFNDYQIAYSMIADYLDTQTKEILFQGLLLINDKQGDYRGQGVTNQGMFHMSSNLHIYNLTGIERYHNTFKRQLRANLDRTHEDYGVASAGYFIELAGCDGSYEYMNRCEFYHMYNSYKKTKNADQKLLADFKSAVEKTLKFESYFCAPQPIETTVEGNVIAPNSFVTRNPNSNFGGGGNPSYEQLFHEFSIAARRMQVFDGRNKNENSSMLGKYGATAAPHHINNEEWALAHINSCYKSYENAYKNTYSDVFPFYTYDAYQANSFAEPELLPCEYDDGTIFEEEGFIGLKHNGIYICSFYGTEEFRGSYARNYAYMGGGPTSVWSEQTGVTLSSQRHLSNYDMPQTPDDIVSSCMYGYDKNGNFLFSGKEGDFSGGSAKASECNTLTWLEYGKSFRIDGKLHNSDKTASWKYTLDEEGILVKAKMFPYLDGDEFWVNLPITVKDAKLSVSSEGNVLTAIYNNDENRFMTYSWDENTQAEFLDTETKNKVKRLRIKLDENGEATFRISATKPDLQMLDTAVYTYSDGGFAKTEELEKDKLNTISVKLRNNTQTAKTVCLVVGVYDVNNKMTNVIYTQKELEPNVKENIATGVTIGDNDAKISVMIFEKLGLLRPQFKAIVKNVRQEG
ncbi:MAG: hypothetical protein II978_03450, partial [Clostridia bacterium]|nr:hypothetical protein [Clostridia bacterium]